MVGDHPEKKGNTENLVQRGTQIWKAGDFQLVKRGEE